MLAFINRLRGNRNATTEAATKTEEEPAHQGLPCSPDRELRASSRSRSPPLRPRALRMSAVHGEGGHQLSFSPRRSHGAPSARRSSMGLRRSIGRRSVGQVPEARRRSLMAAARKSYVHREFANPYAETCWLSCLFQSLWHSTVFHAAFEKDLVLGKYVVGPEERVLEALQLTWKEYAETKASRGAKELSTAPAAEEVVAKAGTGMVPAEDLAQGFVELADQEGYGDISDALACIQQELAASTLLAATQLAQQLAIVPVVAEEVDEELALALSASAAEAGEAASAEQAAAAAAATEEFRWPTPATAWRQAEDFQVSGHALLAVDMSLPEMHPEECEAVATEWLQSLSGDQAAAGKKASEGDLGGGSHQLVALVCYMWTYRHYVAFCRRQQDPTRCIFFNDLPTLLEEAPKELAWRDVPALCRQHSLAPRLVLYESTAAASACFAATLACGAARGGS
eukprot:TRINITY_DN83226_c0_g1_i1.p1 TRINITY_DN83226_c0_g1~~TRINITY_DN83226_c0_g1_i1.p1  ORF type:complete len:456 (-),score=117.01 TRINITY_DN83226_c0_g1_i1:175-1542(-)